MQSKIFNFPQHQGTLFPGVKWTWSRQPTTPRKTSTSSRRWWWRFCFFWGSVFYSLRPKYQKNDNFVLWVVKFHQAIFEGGIREPLRFTRLNFHEVELSLIKMTKIPSPERHTGEVQFLWNPPTRLKKKKNRAGNASPRNSTGRTSFRFFTQNEISTDIHGFVHNGRFWADFGQILWRVVVDHP